MYKKLFGFAAFISILFSQSASGELFLSSQHCRQKYESLQEQCRELDMQWEDCSIMGSASRKYHECRNMDYNQRRNYADQLVQRRNSVCDQKNQTYRICSQMEANERKKRNNENMERAAEERRTQEFQQSVRESMAREQASMARSQQQQQAQRQAEQLKRQSQNANKAQAIGALTSSLMNLFTTPAPVQPIPSQPDSVRIQQDRERQARVDQEQSWMRAEENKRAREREEQQRAREKEEQSIYERLVSQWDSAKSTYETTKEFVKNPFLTMADRASSELSSQLVDGTVSSALPGWAEKRDRNYDTAADVTDRARTIAMAGNPFASQVAGTSMEGVNSLNRRTLGGVHSATESIRNFGRQDASPSSGASQVFRPSTPAPSGGGTDGQTSESYYDHETQVSLAVPTGYVMYREPLTRSISIIQITHLTGSEGSGDRLEWGEKGCSAVSVGVITPECEKMRRKMNNPFK